MHSPVLLLSADTSQSAAWAAILKARGLRIKISDFWPEASEVLQTQPVSVVLHDDDEWIAPAAKVLSAANAVGSPVIVLARDFDATKWMRYFRNGAFDVLRHSTEPTHFCESIEAAMRKSRSRGNLRSWRENLLEWTKSKFYPRVRSDSVEKNADEPRGFE
jgi:DNA-binding NtrC family response regulator